MQGRAGGRHGQFFFRPYMHVCTATGRVLGVSAITGRHVEQSLLVVAERSSKQKQSRRKRFSQLKKVHGSACVFK
jgi:hypothetical protein